MFRTEFELNEMIRERQAEVSRSCQRHATRLATRPQPPRNRVRRAIGQRFVAIGTALVGPL